MSNKMFEIKLAVGMPSECEPDLFGFMQTILANVGSVDESTASPKSVAEILLQIARVDSYHILEAGLYEVSIDAHRNMIPACEKYCLNVIKEIRKIIKKKYK